MLSVGKYRHLCQCSDSHGTMSVLAIDHRGPNEIQRNGKGPATYEEVTAFKQMVIGLLGPASTAVLTDPDLGITALTSGDLPGNVGFMAPLELTNYARATGDRGMDMLPDWSVAKLKRAGISGAKLIMMYHPDAPNAAEKTALVDSIIEQCEREQVPFFFEPISYSLDPEQPLSNAERRQVVIANAQHFTDRGVDILKMEFRWTATRKRIRRCGRPQRRHWMPPAPSPGRC
jgi:tagatose 1,6-diphosphate aldolase